MLERSLLGARRTPLTEPSDAPADRWRPDAASARCPRCAHRIGPFEGDATGCPACRERRLPWSRAVTLGDFEGPLRDAVHELKFRCWRRIGRDLGRLLSERVREELDRCGLAAELCVIVPVPMAYRRRMARGVDHTLEVARALQRSLAAGKGRAKVVRALRRGHRPTQWSVPMSQRSANVAGAFQPRGGVIRRLAERWRSAGAESEAASLASKGSAALAASGHGRGVVVLVDDVMTTGATMRAAARALRAGVRRAAAPGRSSGGRADSGPEIWVAVCAVTPDPARGRAAAEVIAGLEYSSSVHLGDGPG